MKLSLISKIIYSSIIIIIIIILGATGLFLYRYFYSSLVQSQVVDVVKREVAFKVIDIELWEKVKEKIVNKSRPVLGLGQKISDPFTPLETGN